MQDIKAHINMFILNVTFNSSDEVFEKWKSFAKDYFIPTTMQEGNFKNHKIVKVLVEEETGGLTYSIQFSTDMPLLIEQYLNGVFPELMHDLTSAFGDEVMVFPTVLKEEKF